MNLAVPDDNSQHNLVYEFGPFRLDAQTHLLSCDGQNVRLTPKVLDVLFTLVAARGKLVPKEQLMREVWPESFVEESNLTQSISVLRKSLGNISEGIQYIETIPTRGYRFAADVIPVETSSPAEARGIDDLSIPTTESSPGKNFSLAERRWQFSLSIAFVLTSLVVIAFLVRRQHNRSGAAENNSIAVLPFLNLSADPGNDYISDGLTEELIDQLVGMKELRVVARTSVFQFKRRNSDVRSIGRQLNAQFLMEGSVRRERNRLRITVQLNKTTDGYHLWSRTYESEFNNLFAVEEEIAQSVVHLVGKGQAPQDRVSQLKHHPNAEAHEAYLKGLYQKGKVSQSAVTNAIRLFQEASALDPEFAAPHSGLAHAYIALGYSSQLAPKEAYPRARSEVAKAISMDDSLADAHASAAIIHLVYDWDWAGAQSEFEEALALDPKCGLAHHWYSHYFVAMNRFDSALLESRKASEAEPLDLPISAHIGWYYLFSRQFDRAIGELLKSIQLEPNQYWSWGYLRRAYEFKGDFTKAIDVLEKSNVDPDQISELRNALRFNGPAGYWRVRLSEVLARSHREYVQPCYAAQLYLQLADRDKAFEWLEQGLKARDSWLLYLKVDPAWDPVRSDPRFVNLAKRVGIP